MIVMNSRSERGSSGRGPNASHRKLLVLALLGSSMLAPCAYAQSTEPSTTAANTRDPATIEEVVVTARRRDEQLQDVPLAVSAVSGEDLERLSIRNATELVRAAPGLVVAPPTYGSSNLAPTIRSQRQALTNGTYDASTGVYFAEVPAARTQGLNASFYDLESVQVLKGPQGTLFGRNTTGGAVLLTPVAPKPTFGGYVTGMAGNYGLIDIEGAVNMPLSEAIQVRLAGKATRRDGYMDAPYHGYAVDDQHTDSLRASLYTRLSDNIENTLVVTGFWQLDEGLPMKLIKVRPTSRIVLANPNIMDELEFLARSDFHTTTLRTLPQATNIETFTLSNITEFDLGAATIKNIFGYRKVDYTLGYSNDGTNSFLTYMVKPREDAKQFSNELNLSGTALDGRLDYITGLFFFHESTLSGQQTEDNYTIRPTPEEALGMGLGTPVQDLQITEADVVNKSYSVYAQGTYRIPQIETVSVTAGIRFTRDVRAVEWYSRFVIPTPRCRLTDAAGAPLDPCYRAAEVTYEQPTWTLSVDWKPSDNTLLYLAHRRGYRSGGYTFTAYSPSQSEPYRPEIVDDIEFGFKRDWDLVGTQLRTNFAAYYQDYRDIQRNATFFENNRAVTRMYNAASATIKGFELEADWRVTPNLQLSTGISHSDAVYEEFIIDTPTGVQDYTGAEFAASPKWTVNWLARYRLPIATEGDVFAQLSGFYLSDSVPGDVSSYDPVAKETFPDGLLPAYHIIDAGLQWESVMGSTVDLSFFVRNLLNEEYYTYSIDNARNDTRGAVAGLTGPPRTFGVIVKYEF